MKMSITSLVDLCSRGLRAHWAWSVSVSASSKIMTLGGASPSEKNRLCMRLSTKGYIFWRIVSRLRSSLLLRKSRLANLLNCLPWSAMARLWAAVVLPEPGGPRNSMCDRDSGYFIMICSNSGRPCESKITAISL